MRKILIDKVIKNKAIEFAKNPFPLRTKGFETPQERLNKLYNDLRPHADKKHREYVKKIQDEYTSILSATPEDMRRLCKEFDKILSISDLRMKKPYKKYSFYESVVYAMRYEDLRDNEFLSILFAQYIKSCVYCNAQLAIVIDISPKYGGKKKKKVVLAGKLELDHFHAKSKSPFLCTSYFNLYPTCGSCNRAKSHKDVLFELYTEDGAEDLEIFRFWIDDESITKYWISHDYKELKVSFESKMGDIELYKNHNDTFCLQSIYDTQKDVAEELAYKAKVYSHAYKSQLIKAFGKKGLFPDISMINRLIIGNYDKPEDIHKRPMAKYMQDLADQLGLLS